MPVGRLTSEMSSRELAEWQAYFRLEAEDRKRASLDAKAQGGVQATKAARKGRR